MLLSSRRQLGADGVDDLELVGDRATDLENLLPDDVHVSTLDDHRGDEIWGELTDLAVSEVGATRGAGHKPTGEQTSCQRQDFPLLGVLFHDQNLRS